MEDHMSNRVCWVFLVCLMYCFLQVGCAFNEGRVSNHSFFVAFNQNGPNSKADVVAGDIEQFAIDQGFVQLSEPIHGITSSKLKSFRYMLKVDRDNALILAGGYTRLSKGMVVQLYGPDQMKVQHLADDLYRTFKAKFSLKYGEKNISDNLN